MRKPIAILENTAKSSAVWELHGCVAVLGGRQPACVPRLALQSPPSLPFFALFPRIAIDGLDGIARNSGQIFLFNREFGYEEAARRLGRISLPRSRFVSILPRSRRNFLKRSLVAAVTFGTGCFPNQQRFYIETGTHFIPTPAKYKKEAPFLKEADNIDAYSGARQALSGIPGVFQGFGAR